MEENIKLKIENLKFSYSEKKLIIRDVSLSLFNDDIVVLLGENGAGKTTLINLILELLIPLQGKITLNTKKVSFVLDKSSMLPDLTVNENYYFYRNILGENELKKSNNFIELLGIGDYLNSKYKTLSTGIKKRVELGRALLNSPELLILDEPTDGIDPIGRYEIKKIIKELSSSYNCSILLTTHNLLEAEEIAERVIFLNDGKIFADEKMSSIIKQGKSLENFFMEVVKKHEN